MMSNSQLHVMKGEGHLLVVTSAEETAAAIRTFLQRSNLKLVVSQAA